MNPSAATGEFNALATALAGQYEVDREIGRGGMGVVYLARDLRLDRLVAIKTLPVQLGGDSALRERFLREARTAARLSHPNIVPIHRADELGGLVFFVMGFVDGDSLAARLKSGPLLPGDAIPVLRDVASALGYAHKHGVVHRDVKTENIMIESSTGRAMVTDFGIARVAEAAPLTATGQVLGTVYYLSPEQVAGDDVDGRSDIYALGVVGYAMLAGRFPFDGLLASAVLVAHVTKQPPPLSTMAPDVPRSLAAIIDRCLAKDPARRFQSCAELDAALLAAEPEANAARAQSPFVSDTEAHAIFKRAAELQDMTGAHTVPAPALAPRDPARDASRTSGFKTTDLREAAKEAGIGEQHVQRALAERGIGARSSTKEVAQVGRPTAGRIDDRSERKGQFLTKQPHQIKYELLLEGEMDERDFDLVVDAIRSTVGDTGNVVAIGRSLTWNSKLPIERPLEVTVFPRHGRTTIRVAESLKQLARKTYVAVGLAGAFVGFIAWNVVLDATAGRQGPPGFWPWAAWAATIGLSTLAGVIYNNIQAKNRQSTLRKLVNAIGIQAKASIEATKKG